MGAGGGEASAFLGARAEPWAGAESQPTPRAAGPALEGDEGSHCGVSLHLLGQQGSEDQENEPEEWPRTDQRA